MIYLINHKGAWAHVQGRALVCTHKSTAEKFIAAQKLEGAYADEYSKNPLAERYLLVDEAGKPVEVK